MRRRYGFGVDFFSDCISNLTWSLEQTPETAAKETIQTVIIENDKKSHIKSLTLTVNCSDQNKQPRSVIKLVFNIDEELTLHRHSYCDDYLRNRELQRLGPARVIHTFLSKNRFHIGSKFIGEIADFFKNDFTKHGKISLPSERETIQKLCELANERLYVDMVNILSGVELFTLTGDIIAMEERKNPLNTLVHQLLITYPGDYPEVSNHYGKLIPAIKLLCEKEFYFSGYFYPKIAKYLKRKEQPLIVDALLCLTRHGYEEDGNKKNLAFRETLQKTPFWQKQPHEMLAQETTLTAEMFNNRSVDKTKYQAYRDYFIKVSKLFCNPQRCLDYLTFIESRLVKKVSFDHKRFKTEDWLALGQYIYPLPPKTHQHTKKNLCLEKLLVSILSGKEFDDHPKINLLPSGGFWRTFGFIDNKVANSLVASGELFCESGFALNENTHGSKTHALQIALLILAHLSGDIPFPGDDSIKDVLGLMVSEQMKCDGEPLWTALFDKARLANFHSPIFMQAYLMNLKTEATCPTLSFYLRESFWRHYQVTSKKTKLEVEGQIMLDFIATGYFSDNKRFCSFDLTSHYESKQTKLDYHPESKSLFKKRKLAPITSDDRSKEIHSSCASGPYFDKPSQENKGYSPKKACLISDETVYTRPPSSEIDLFIVATALNQLLLTRQIGSKLLMSKLESFSTKRLLEWGRHITEAREFNIAIRSSRLLNRFHQQSFFGNVEEYQKEESLSQLGQV